MSKASEWANKRAEALQITAGTVKSPVLSSDGVDYARVTDYGGLEMLLTMMSGPQALAVAAWIQDTFSDS